MTDPVESGEQQSLTGFPASPDADTAPLESSTPSPLELPPISVAAVIARMLIGTLATAAVALLLGWLIWEVLLDHKIDWGFAIFMAVIISFPPQLASGIQKLLPLLTAASRKRAA
ncbi:MAG: hypothetical protein LBC29_06630 [Propionibacteriaceae bacterium]|jgi:hypothetical protein|nr:hypothetical protein [Propionibacteriaceae bacterium]